jgi:iron complex transport system ATP-binding protein
VSALDHSEALLSARDLRLRAGKRTVLSGVNIDLRPGELTAVIGPNGSGKSTLLSALAGLRPIEPGQGELMLAGKAMASFTRAALARRIAFLPARTDVPFPLSVSELIAQGQPTDEARAEAIAAMELTGLEHSAMTRLSTGEARRAWLAMTLARRTRVLLLDEPLSGLDPRYQLRLLDALRRRTGEGASVTFVAHDLPYVSQADRVIALGGGTVAADGPPQDVLQADLLRRLYGVEVWVGTEPSSGAVVPLPLRAV